MQQIRLGRIGFSSLDDGSFACPARAFFHNVPEAVWHAHLATDAEGKITVGHNYGLVETDDALVVIDTGYGDDTHGGQAGHLLAELERSGHRREDVDCVVLTHAHGDHIRRNTLRDGGARRPTFPRARFYLGRADHDWFGGPGRVPEFDEQIAPLERLGQLVLVDGETALATGITLLPTPGHTPGHLSVLIESEGRSALFLGDVCHHPLHFAHPDWVSEFDTGPSITVQTRAWLFALAAGRDAVVLCPHMPAPGFGRVRRAGYAYAWQALAEPPA